MEYSYVFVVGFCLVVFGLFFHFGFWGFMVGICILGIVLWLVFCIRRLGMLGLLLGGGFGILCGVVGIVVGLVLVFWCICF